MKEKFFEYYPKSKKEYKELWDTCLFVFDTNVLLDLYRYSSATSKQLLKIIELLSDRVWIPHTVGYEYQERRLGVITSQENSYKPLLDSFDKCFGDMKNGLDMYNQHPFLDTAELTQIVEECKEKLFQKVKHLEEKHPNWFENDTIREELTKIFAGKVGDKYDGDKFKELYDTAEKRYETKTPPGYEDNSKTGDNKYNDFIIWREIIDKAAKEHRSIIFVTDDKKEDWWWKVSGKTKGPRCELIREMYSESGMEFWMYQVDRFIDYANGYLKFSVTPDVIKEIQQVSLHKEQNIMSENEDRNTMFGRTESFHPAIRRQIIDDENELDITRQEIDYLRKRLNNIEKGENRIMSREKLESLDEHHQQHLKKMITNYNEEAEATKKTILALQHRADDLTRTLHLLHSRLNQRELLIDRYNND